MSFSSRATSATRSAKRRDSLTRDGGYRCHPLEARPAAGPPGRKAAQQAARHICLLMSLPLPHLDCSFDCLKMNCLPLSCHSHAALKIIVQARTNANICTNLVEQTERTNSLSIQQSTVGNRNEASTIYVMSYSPNHHAVTFHLGLKRQPISPRTTETTMYVSSLLSRLASLRDQCMAVAIALADVKHGC
eukprot:scaffold446545_cov19-Prasinocladus_malaysianus.AAC.1